MAALVDLVAGEEKAGCGGMSILKPSRPRTLRWHNTTLPGEFDWPGRP